MLRGLLSNLTGDQKIYGPFWKYKLSTVSKKKNRNFELKMHNFVEFCNYILFIFLSDVLQRSGA